MHLDDIRKVLKHCYGRQAESGPESSFRFSIFIGPKRQRLAALYPDASNPKPNKLDSGPRKKKNKGKQREDPLHGLLRIDESAEAPTADHIIVEQQITNPTAAGPSNQYQMPDQYTTAGSHQNDVVRIDMGQMLKLKDMGLEVVGPVNGPNEGYPEYEVSHTTYQVLIASMQSQNVPHPSGGNIAPDPAPITIDPALLGQIARNPHSIAAAGMQAQNVPHPSGANIVTDPGPMSIDPALLGQIARSPHNTAALTVTVGDLLNRTALICQASSEVMVDPLHLSEMAHPTTPTRTVPDPGDIPTRTNTQLGKRSQANLSPRRTRTAKKKKKVTDDDRAAMEAENMLQAGSKRTRKSTRRK
jgi:hypothetical protein